MTAVGLVAAEGRSAALPLKLAGTLRRTRIAILAVQSATEAEMKGSEREVTSSPAQGGA